MHYLRLTGAFIRASIQEETAYQANFWISAFHSLLNLGTGVLGISVLFTQVERLQGWSFGSTLAVLGVYLTVSALRSLFIGPSLDALAGMDGEVWTGALDFILLRPVDIQFMASTRRWRAFALFDLLLALGVLAAAVRQTPGNLTLEIWLAFLGALGAGIMILYAILLAATALVFWSPEVLFTWIFDGVFQLARFPLGIYPGWLRLALTWVLPVGVITTVPARVLSGVLDPGTLAASLALAAGLLIAASAFFRLALQRYASASS